MWRDRQVHGHGLVADYPKRMELVYECDAHLAGAHDAGLAIDGELGPALQHEEDLVAEVVGVGASPLAGFHPHEAGAYLRCDQHVPDVFPIVVDGERHFSLLLVVCRNGPAASCGPMPSHWGETSRGAAPGGSRECKSRVDGCQRATGRLTGTVGWPYPRRASYFSTRKPTALFPNRW